MESTIWLADGFVVITGEIGSGKTTLLQSFLSELPEDVVYAVDIANATVDHRISAGRTDRIWIQAIRQEKG